MRGDCTPTHTGTLTLRNRCVNLSEWTQPIGERLICDRLRPFGRKDINSLPRWEESSAECVKSHHRDTESCSFFFFSALSHTPDTLNTLGDPDRVAPAPAPTHPPTRQPDRWRAKLGEKRGMRKREGGREVEDGGVQTSVCFSAASSTRRKTRQKLAGPNTHKGGPGFLSLTGLQRGSYLGDDRKSDCQTRTWCNLSKKHRRLGGIWAASAHGLVSEE